MQHFFREGSRFRPIPQLGLRFLADSNNWNANGKRQNCVAQRQMIRNS